MFVERRNFGPFFKTLSFAFLFYPTSYLHFANRMDLYMYSMRMRSDYIPKLPFDFFQYLDPNLSNSLLFDRQWDPLTGFGRFWISIYWEKDNFLVNPLKFWFWKWGSRLSQLLVEISALVERNRILFTNSLTSGSLFWICTLMLDQSNEFSWIFQSVFKKPRQRNNAINSKHSKYLIVITDLIPLIEWTCYFKKLFEGIDFKNFACRVKNFHKLVNCDAIDSCWYFFFCK